MPQDRSTPLVLLVQQGIPWVWVLLLAAGPAEAQEPPKASVRALPLGQEVIRLDGLLDEAIWSSAEPARDFLQQRPASGVPESGGSTVRVLFDEANLYIGAILADPDPEKVRADERHRDALLDRSDAFGVWIDTYHDHQNAFFFETNPLGAQSDALVGSEGEMVNRDWNGLWDVAARRSATGWSLEMRIPFQTLRHYPGEEQVWGIQFRRRIPRLTETSFWSPLAPEQNFFEISRGGHLLGIGAEHPTGRLLLKPYAKGGYRYNATEREQGWEIDHDGGLDLRYRHRANLTLDLTYRTDFAETEADRLQVNLTRFPLFFPEKREFFLEGKGFYEFGLSGQDQPFFSRRIGLASGGPVPIAGGGKLTGKVGPYGLGLLWMQTEDGAAGIPAEQFGVLRVTRDLGLRSQMGLIGTHRADRGKAGGQTVGWDATFAPHPHLTSDFFWMRSGGSDVDASGQAVLGQFSWRDPFWRIFLRHHRVDEQFDPRLGFVRQRDLAETYGYIDIRPHPAGGPVREFGFKGEMTYQAETDGDFLYRSHYWRAQADFKSGDFILLSVDPQAERLPEPFEIRPGIVIPEGKYRYTHFNLYLSSDPRRALSSVVSFLWGGIYGGRQRSLDVDLTFAPGAGVTLGTNLGIDWVSLPQGSFTAQILEGEAAWAVSNLLLLQGLLQWDKEARTVAANIRFSWEYRPGSHLYVVANPFHRGDEDTVLIFVKLTWQWEPI